jgi:hypothetical protein
VAQPNTIWRPARIKQELHMKSDAQLMEDDLRRGCETREVEFKSWMNIADGLAAIKIVRSIAALANRGGGRIYFGVSDEALPLPSNGDFPLSMFSAEVVHRIMKRHLQPEFECEIRNVEYQGDRYPVIHVPSHGEMPIIAKSDKGDYDVFVRSTKPEVIPAHTVDQWTELLESCIDIRSKRHAERSEEVDLIKVDQIARKVTEQLEPKIQAAIAAMFAGKQAELPDWKLIARLSEDTRRDFADQILGVDIEGFGKENDAYKELLALIPSNNVLSAYALLTEEDRLIAVDDLRALLGNASRHMKSVAYAGWSDFVTLTTAEGRPRTRQWDIDNGLVTGIEGMRLENMKVFGATFDYWRVYSNGIFSICQSYDEDHGRVKSSRAPYLTVRMILIRTHFLLAHAHFAMEMVPHAEKIAIVVEPCGLANRLLLSGVTDDARILGHGVSSDRFQTRIVFSRVELLGDYTGTLVRLLNKLSEPYGVEDGYFTTQRVTDMMYELERMGITAKIPTGVVRQ